MLITWGITNELMQMDHNSPNISINTNITDGYTFTVHSSNSSFYIVRFADLVLVLLKYLHSVFFLFMYEIGIELMSSFYYLIYSCVCKLKSHQIKRIWWVHGLEIPHLHFNMFYFRNRYMCVYLYFDWWK